MKVNEKTGLKKCTGVAGCGRSMTLDKFYAYTKSPDGRARICIECQKKKGAEYRQKNRQKILNYLRDYRATIRGASVEKERRFTRYGINQNQYEETLRSQDFRCAICKTDKPSLVSGTETFVIDHDHETGLFRGILCNRCNLLIGSAEEKVLILASAIRYLEDHSNGVNPATQITSRDAENTRKRDDEAESLVIAEIENDILNGSCRLPVDLVNTPKRCPVCGVTKERSQFAKDRGHPSGLYHCCKSCQSIRDRLRTLPKKRSKTKKS